MISLLPSIGFAPYFISSRINTIVFASFITFTILLAMSFTATHRDFDTDVSQVYAQLENETLVNSASSNLTLPKLFSQASDSVVQVTTTNLDNNFAGPVRSGLGSGFVYDTNGHIVTNYHVVAQAAAGTTSSPSFSSTTNRADVLVTLHDGSIHTARLVGSDPFSDIAVLRVENISDNKLNPLPFGNSSQLIIGQQVVAIGNPFGLSGTMTEGIISGLGRIIPSTETSEIPGDNQPPPEQGPLPPELRIPPFNDPFGDNIPDMPVQEEALTFSIPDIIQTDAAVNPGNSGGPLLDMNGRVIGMNTAIFSTTGAYSGVGFAIPSNMITKVVPSLIRSGFYQHPWLGISGVDITPSIARALGLGLNEARGFLVISVNEGSPADKAGLRGGDRVTNVDGRELQLGGDIILKIDNQTIGQIDDMLSYLERESQAGDTVQLTVLRDGEEQTVDVTLAARPGSAQQQQQQQPPSPQQPSLGISGIDVTPEIRESMNLTHDSGFLVVDVIAGGPADKAGIQGGYIVTNINGTEIEIGGDVITKIDNRTVTTINDIYTYLNTKKVGDTVQLTVLQDGEQQTVDVTLAAASAFEQQQEQQRQILPSEPEQPQLPDQDSDSIRPFEDFYNRCVETLGRQFCSPLYGR